MSEHQDIRPGGMEEQLLLREMAVVFLCGKTDGFTLETGYRAWSAMPEEEREALRAEVRPLLPLVMRERACAASAAEAEVVRLRGVLRDLGAAAEAAYDVMSNIVCCAYAARAVSQNAIAAAPKVVEQQTPPPHHEYRHYINDGDCALTAEGAPLEGMGTECDCDLESHTLCHRIPRAEVGRLTGELKALVAKWRHGTDPLEFRAHTGERGVAVALRAAADQLERVLQEPKCRSHESQSEDSQPTVDTSGGG